MPLDTIKGVRRFDVGAVSGIETSPQGYLRCDGRLTRTGVFTYRDGKGGIRRELRLPAEVFAEDAIGSFALAPLTDDHPGESLSPSNTGKYQVGTIAAPRRDGEYVGARIQVTDAKAIKAVEGGKRELSCGYYADLEPTPGVTAGIDGVPDGLKYDAIQRNIRGNHVAIVDAGRAGPGASLRLDHSDAVIVPDDEPAQPSNPRADAPDQGETMPVKIKIDGVEVEVSETAAQLIAKREDTAGAAIAEAKAEADELKASVATEKARADKAEEDLEAEKKARKDAADPAKLREKIDARLDLERTAGPILGDEVKLDELDDDSIKRAVVVKTAADAKAIETKLDANDAAYLSARFDAAVEGIDKSEPRTDEGLAAIKRVGAGGTEIKLDAKAAREKMMEEARKLGREPIAS